MSYGYPDDTPTWNPAFAHHEALIESLRESDCERHLLEREWAIRERREQIRKAIESGLV